MPSDRIDELQKMSDESVAPPPYSSPFPTKTILPPVRTFETGATRDTDDGKYDYEGFLSPVVLERFAAYMHKNRYQSNGQFRDADNWQKGIPLAQYMKSGYRHFMDWWRFHRLGRVEATSPMTPFGYDQTEDALCALMFNTMGYLHELLKEREKNKAKEQEQKESPIVWG